MKYHSVCTIHARKVSLPVRGAWIEIDWKLLRWQMMFSRSPCGERGLKFPFFHFTATSGGRSPCGERGLKYIC